jgi:hypothetical protein
MRSGLGKNFPYGKIHSYFSGWDNEMAKEEMGGWLPRFSLDR